MNKQQLANKIWESANKMRSKIEANEYKDYILGFIFGIVTIIRKLVVPNISVGWSSTVSIMLFIGGLIMLMLGMIGEYIGRIYISINNSPQYVVKETINIDEDE